LALSRITFAIARLFLFLLPAELSHNLGLKTLRFLHQCGLGFLIRMKIPDCPVKCLGLTFQNPVGLAAGLDKNADYVDALGDLGFGFIEVGTVTPRPQSGNPMPRLFRLKRERAIINRMGFNNKGVDHMVERLQQRRYRGIIGVNIGKNLTTPVENALDDYLYCLQKVYALADYIVVNLSSPNTPGLRALQFGEQLDRLLAALKREQLRLKGIHQRDVPVLVKIAPDLNEQEVGEIASYLLKREIEGVIATNTTIDRIGIDDSPFRDKAGGLSGAPLTEKSTAVLETLSGTLDGKMPVIGVGGIVEGKHAALKLAAGATLVQIYSGFIYRGPPLIAECVEAVRDRVAG
jgi:dihydroorotate dehydrogenase